MYRQVCKGITCGHPYKSRVVNRCTGMAAASMTTMVSLIVCTQNLLSVINSAFPYTV